MTRDARGDEMKLFKCHHCGARVFFENNACVGCGHALGFDPGAIAIVTLAPAEAPEGGYTIAGRPSGEIVHYCANADHGVCNWLTTEAGGLCRACLLNRTIPNLSEPGNLEAWRELELAKKRLIYSLLRFGLPFDTASGAPQDLAFDFVQDATTGHFDGVVTINVNEADAVERERQRQQFQEPYRSLLGHLRHESGHYYWPLLVEGGELERFRALFGDEREDYGAALARHHEAGPPGDWPLRYLTAYASTHPWEDWAETWAHYLHMVDSLDTADADGLDPRAAGIRRGAMWSFESADVYGSLSFSELIERWVPLTVALNSLSRSMGHADFYPFVLSPPALEKLAFVHALLVERRRFKPSGQGPADQAAPTEGGLRAG
jgi:hypothetical protein